MLKPTHCMGAPTLGLEAARHQARRAQGFTVIELLVVLACIGLLLSIAAPRYIQHLDHAREMALKEDLHAIRLALDQFYSDRGRYPASLADLVSKRYLRALPEDPITNSTTTWITSPPPPEAVRTPATGEASGEGPGIADVHSGATGQASDGSTYASW